MEGMAVQVLLTELETALESVARALACLIPARRIPCNPIRIVSNPAPQSPISNEDTPGLTKLSNSDILPIA